MTGEIRVRGRIDYEEMKVHKIDVLAMDRGQVPMSVHCSVIVRIDDVNDNTPEIDVTSLSDVISEGSKVGTTIALISVSDRDAGNNAQIVCQLSESVPFELKPSFRKNFYSVLTTGPLDREYTPVYGMTITARDLGTPPLSSSTEITVRLSDVNDNSPRFSENNYLIYLHENNVPGGSIFCVSAIDADEEENARVSYALGKDYADTRMNAFLNINSESGIIYALKSFDFETLKTFQFQVVAKDSGTPSLSSNATVNVFILDKNDNAPVILSPLSSNGSAEGVEEIPRNVNAGHSVTKVRAYDADIGYNAWLSFSLQHATDASLFGLERYTGQIRTLRSFTETDEAQHKLVIVVKDNGNVSLSATATVIINAVEPKEAFAASETKGAEQTEEENNVTFYLIITLGSVSALFLFSIIGLIVMQCSKPDYSTKYSQDSNYADTSGNGTLCHSIQYRSGDKRYMLVGPRMSIGSAIVPGMRAYDADIGYNAWLSFSLQHATDASLFGLERYSGQIRTLRSFTETDEAQHKLLVVVKDNGNVSLSATATVIINAVEPKEAFAASDTKTAVQTEEENNVTFYLIITLGSVSALFLLSIIGLIVMQCSKPEYPSKYSRDSNYADMSGNGTLCHSIQYRSGDKRYMLVGPRMSIGSTIVPGSNSNTLVVPDHRRRISEEFTMERSGVQHTMTLCRIALPFCFVLCFGARVSAQLRYSVPEEVKKGTVVGTVAKDLGFDVSTLEERRFRIVSGSEEPLFQVNPNNGALYVDKRIDREEICDGNAACSINLKIIAENPLEVHHAAVEILDVNDHSPSFLETELQLEIAESTLPGARFQLQAAYDPDSGVNSVRFYKLNQNEHFELEVRDRGKEKKIPYLVLQKALDREHKAEHRLLLTAVDGGNPPKSGNLNVTVAVLDNNDNRPVFGQDVYSVTLEENVKIGSVVIKVNATDRDQGANGDVEYTFGRNLNRKALDTFSLDRVSGEIRVKGQVDFEDTEVYELDVQASDKGQHPMTVDCSVIIKIRDVNDNSPEIDDSGTPSLSSNTTVNVFILDKNDNAPVILSPLSTNGSAEDVEEIPRNVNAGHSVTKVRAYDADIGYNAWLSFSLQHATDASLFGLERYTGQIRTLRSFTETDEAQHKLVIVVKDNGNVSLSATATVIINAVEPKEAFAASDTKGTVQTEEENNCSKPDYSTKYSRDSNYADMSGNGTLCHSIQYRSGDKRGEIRVKGRIDFEDTEVYELDVQASDKGQPPMTVECSVIIKIRDVNDNSPEIDVTGDGISSDMSPFLNINSETGIIYALKNFDFETMKTFKFQVVAKDSGTPSLSSNATVNVFILDQNDNAPVILSPISSNGSAEGVEEIPRNVNAGHSVTKVRAYDADIGYNAWLSFSLQHATDASLFGLERYTGQIRTLRSFTEIDEAQHKLVIVVKDNGNVSLSATATVIINAVEPKEAFAASDTKTAVQTEEENNVTFYLIITLGSVSALFLLSIIGLIVMQCSKPDYSSKYSRDSNYADMSGNGTLCHSIQYRSGDKRYMLVGPRMSIGSTIVPGSNANTLVVPDHRRRISEEVLIFIRI
ncbi:hypothetical protein JZ751_005346 [Albula glossodonta]|uniref:Cadherin domain-containing protein n=1 Tax=Albula glossodonta TaxID=121402 RepID=A0A8T2N5S7_9TELE|nr:hypothetical protein JZ751_005346 [Albula glossodonta]